MFCFHNVWGVTDAQVVICQPKLQKHINKHNIVVKML